MDPTKTNKAAIDFMQDTVPAEQTNLRRVLATVNEPTPGYFDFVDGTRVPRAVQFTPNSALAYAHATALFDMGESPGIVGALHAAECAPLAPLLLAAALNCANASHSNDAAREREWDSKCYELIAIVNGLFSDRVAERNAPLNETAHRARAAHRVRLANLVFNATGVVTRDRTHELNAADIHVASRLN